MHKALLPEMTLTDYMCQVKKEEEDLAALKTVLAQQYNDFKTAHKSVKKTDYSHQKQYWPHEDQQNGNNLKWEDEKLYGRFKRLISNIPLQKTCTWLRKGNLKREMESLLIVAKNNVLRTNHIKAIVDKRQENSKFTLCNNRDETIDLIISKGSKLSHKEYKTRHDWFGKVIHWKMWKEFIFNYTKKWYMHNPTSKGII